MGHITFQYESYYRPTPAPPQGRGAKRHSNKTYKSYKTHKYHKYHSANKPLLPPYEGTVGGFSGELRGLQYEQQE